MTTLTHAQVLRAAHATEDHEGADESCSCLYWAAQWESAYRAQARTDRPVYGSLGRPLNDAK